MESERSNLLESNYYKDTLIYLVSKSQELIFTDYLDSTQHMNILPEMRTQACNWIFDLCADCGTSSKTPQLACHILDSFLSKKRLSNLTILKLIKALAVHIAMKFEHDLNSSFLSQKDIEKLCGSRFSLKAISDTELYILQVINWNFNAPTASEIMRHMLLAVCPDYDFSELCSRSDAYCAMCYADYSLIMFRPHVISAASVCCVLERRGQLDFKRDWLNSLCQISELRLNLDEINLCAQQIEYRISTYPSIRSADSSSTNSSETI